MSDHVTYVTLVGAETISVVRRLFVMHARELRLSRSMVPAVSTARKQESVPFLALQTIVQAATRPPSSIRRFFWQSRIVEWSYATVSTGNRTVQSLQVQIKTAIHHFHQSSSPYNINMHFLRSVIVASLAAVANAQLTGQQIAEEILEVTHEVQKVNYIAERLNQESEYNEKEVCRSTVIDIRLR